MRGDGAGEDVDEDNPPQDGRVVGDDGGDDFPSRREVSPVEQLCRSPRLVSAKVPPRDGGVWSRKPPPDFFHVKTPQIGEDGNRGPAG